MIPEVTASALQWPRFMMILVLRTSVDPLNLVSAVDQQVNSLDKNLPVYGAQTMDDVLSAQVTSQRFNAGATAGFAVLAVLLADVGIYGVMTFVLIPLTKSTSVARTVGALQAPFPVAAFSWATPRKTYWYQDFFSVLPFSMFLN
jgi:hypothetical protein